MPKKAKLEMAGGHKLRWQSFEGWTKTVNAMVATQRVHSNVAETFSSFDVSPLDSRLSTSPEAENVDEG